MLTGNRMHFMERREFYRHLNKFSNYHSFFKVRDDLIDRELIEIQKNHEKKYIKLTDKGIRLYNKLMEVYDIIKNK